MDSPRAIARVARAPPPPEAATSENWHSRTYCQSLVGRRVRVLFGDGTNEQEDGWYRGTIKSVLAGRRQAGLLVAYDDGEEREEWDLGAELCKGTAVMFDGGSCSHCGGEMYSGDGGNADDFGPVCWSCVKRALFMLREGCEEDTTGLLSGRKHALGAGGDTAGMQNGHQPSKATRQLRSSSARDVSGDAADDDNSDPSGKRKRESSARRNQSVKSSDAHRGTDGISDDGDKRRRVSTKGSAAGGVESGQDKRKQVLGGSNKSKEQTSWQQRPSHASNGHSNAAAGKHKPHGSAKKHALLSLPTLDADPQRQTQRRRFAGIRPPNTPPAVGPRMIPSPPYFVSPMPQAQAQAHPSQPILRDFGRASNADPAAAAVGAALAAVTAADIEC